jgi:valyl-tRNA synthetase
VKLSEDKITEARNFANKIWNVARFVEMNRSPVQNPKLQIRTELELADKWILSRLNNTIKKVTEEIDQYQFGEAAHALYDFIWSEFCDWYIEIAKIRLYGQDDKAKLTVQAVLLTALEGILKLLHPFMPFITEEIWSRINTDGSLMLQAWPKPNEKAIDTKAEAEMDAMMGVVRAVRNIRAEFNVPHGKEIDVVLVTEDVINETYLRSLAKVGKLTINKELLEKPKQSASAVVEKSQVFVLLAGLIDPDKETGRIKKDAEKLEIELAKVRNRLSDQNFLTRATPESVQKEKEKEVDFAAKVKLLEERLKDLQ